MSFNKKLLAIILLLITNLLFCEEKKDKMKVVLGKNQYESYFSVGSGIRGEIPLQIYSGVLGTEITFGFDQRCGIGNNLELEYKGNISVNQKISYFTFFYGIFSLPSVISNNEFLFKIKLWGNDRSGLSIEPKIKIFSGIKYIYPMYISIDNITGILGSDIGFNLIGSNKLKGKINNIYYGGSLSFYQDFLNFGISYYNYLNDNSFITTGFVSAFSKRLISIYLPLIYFNTGFTIGWETRSKYIYKNEINFSTSFGLFKLFEKYSTSEFKSPFLAGDVSISLSYTFYFGKYYEGKK